MKNKNLWPYGILASILLFIAGSAGLLVFALSQRYDLVSKNYYDDEIRYQSRIDGTSRALQLGARADYNKQTKHIEIVIPSSQIGKIADGKIQLYRPSAEQMDQQFALQPNANGVQSIDTASLQPGLWKLRVSWAVSCENFFFEQKIVIGEKSVAVK